MKKMILKFIVREFEKISNARYYFVFLAVTAFAQRQTITMYGLSEASDLNLFITILFTGITAVLIVWFIERIFESLQCKFCRKRTCQKNNKHQCHYDSPDPSPGAEG